MQGRIRFLHLMVDSKFIDYFIEQSEVVAPGESEYWVVKENGKSNITSTKDIVTPIDWNKENFTGLAEKAAKFDKLIVHSFFFPSLDRFFNSIPKDLTIVWMFWGADGYSYTWETKKWFQPLTLKWKKMNRNNNVNFLKGLYRELYSFRQDLIKSKVTKKLIRRVNVCGTWVKYDYEMIKHINPKMSFAYYSYFTFEQMVFSDVANVNQDFNRIWLGNSATDTNNHLDALQYLSDIKWQGEIIVPLSYGDKEYGEYIESFGKKLFGDRFIPLWDLLPLKEYQQLMNSCGIVWMNHIRQQAAGNIIAALFMGKAVIMNSHNNLYKTLKDMNIQFIEKEVLKDVQGINENSFFLNSSIIKQKFSNDHILDAIKKIYLN